MPDATLSPAQIERLINVTAQLGPWAMPMVQAVQQRVIALQTLQRSDRAPLAEMRRASLPVVAWLGDDDEASCGPDGWRCAHQATRWARAAIVHAAGGQAEHYAEAVRGAVVTGRLLLIETASRHALQWAELLRGKPTLVIYPRTGPHPVDRRETRH